MFSYKFVKILILSCLTLSDVVNATPFVKFDNWSVKYHEHKIVISSSKEYEGRYQFSRDFDLQIVYS